MQARSHDREHQLVSGRNRITCVRTQYVTYGCGGRSGLQADVCWQVRIVSGPCSRAARTNLEKTTYNMQAGYFLAVCRARVCARISLRTAHG